MKHKLLLALFLSLCSLVSWAMGINVDGIYYMVNATKGYAVVMYPGTSSSNPNPSSSAYKGNVVIPSSVTISLTTYPVTGISAYAFKGCSNLTSVTIPSSVTSIGSYAFTLCI